MSLLIVLAIALIAVAPHYLLVASLMKNLFINPHLSNMLPPTLCTLVQKYFFMWLLIECLLEIQMQYIYWFHFIRLACNILKDL